MDVRRQGQAGEHSYAEPPAPATSRKSDKSGTPIKTTLMWLGAALAVVVLAWFALRAFAFVTQDSAVKGNEFQAVFLTNGQVYFGKFSQVDSDYVKLTDIFYLQVQQSVQPSSTSSSQQPQVSLAKLGGELHGPEDVMYIAKSQVLFWENLKSSGKVSQAIQKYNQGGSH